MKFKKKTCKINSIFCPCLCGFDFFVGLESRHWHQYSLRSTLPIFLEWTNATSPENIIIMKIEKKSIGGTLI